MQLTVVFTIAGQDERAINGQLLMRLLIQLKVNDEPTVLIFNKRFFQPRRLRFG
jgi:hypothetical protein